MILLQAFTVGLIGFSIGTGMAAEFFNFFGQKMATRGNTRADVDRFGCAWEDGHQIGHRLKIFRW
jgi:hypothetical protein